MVATVLQRISATLLAESLAISIRRTLDPRSYTEPRKVGPGNGISFKVFRDGTAAENGSDSKRTNP